MRRRLGTLLVVVAAALSTIGVAAAPQVVVVAGGGVSGIVPPPAVTGDALIMGRVVDGTSRQPVSGATVVLGGYPPPASAPSAGVVLTLGISGSGQSLGLTNSEGQFVFRDLAEGRYNLSVQAAGYLPGAHGMRRPEGAPASIRLGAGESRTDVEISVWKAASISGLVVDELGEPVVEVPIRAMRRTMVRGRPSFIISGGSTTDDRGLYRIGNLVPGDYVVFVPSTLTTMPVSVADAYLAAIDSGDPASRQMVGQMASGGNVAAAGGITVGDQRVQADYGRALTPAPAPGERFSVYPMAFHPAATSPQEATVVAVGSGEELMGIDIRTALVPSFSISGVAVGPAGPVTNTLVRLVPAFVSLLAFDGGLTAVGTTTDAQGRFTIIGATPGDYRVRVLRAPQLAGLGSVVRAGDGSMMLMEGALTGAAPDTTSLSGEEPVAVRDRDVTGLAITVTAGATVSGRVEFVGKAKPPTAVDLGRGSVTLARVDGQSIPASLSTRVDQAGTFSTRQYPAGAYTLAVSVPAAGWYLRSVRVGGREMIDRAIDLASDLTDVVVTFTDTLAELAGTARAPDRPGGEVSGSVVLFPADHREWIATGMSPRRARRVDVASNGAFEMHSLLPGDYLAAAVTADSQFDLQDPADVDALARVATPVAVSDAPRTSLLLSITRLR